MLAFLGLEVGIKTLGQCDARPLLCRRVPASTAVPFSDRRVAQLVWRCTGSQKVATSFDCRSLRLRDVSVQVGIWRRAEKDDA